jgi:hypothetical protein
MFELCARNVCYHLSTDNVNVTYQRQKLYVTVQYELLTGEVFFE